MWKSKNVHHYLTLIENPSWSIPVPLGSKRVDGPLQGAGARKFILLYEGPNRQIARSTAEEWHKRWNLPTIVWRDGKRSMELFVEGGD